MPAYVLRQPGYEAGTQQPEAVLHYGGYVQTVPSSPTDTTAQAAPMVRVPSLSSAPGWVDSTPLPVVIASQNPVKRRATVEAVQAALQPSDIAATTIEVTSGVPPQPWGDPQTRQGARNRAEAARAACPDATLWVGLEGGIIERDDVLEAMAWAVVLGRVADDAVRRGESRTATFTLPCEIADLVRSGSELGAATDQVFGGTGTKQGSGTVGPLTGGVIDRVSYYAHAVVLALVPLRDTGVSFAEPA